jgi:DNA-directed RNA polymerase specialized sigma24 family protein
MQKDAFLVQQTLAGEHEAFHRLIILYQADIYALILSDVKNPEDAEELVQDVFLNVWSVNLYFTLSQIKRSGQNLQKAYLTIRIDDSIIANVDTN